MRSHAEDVVTGAARGLEMSAAAASLNGTKGTIPRSSAACRLALGGVGLVDADLAWVGTLNSGVEQGYKLLAVGPALVDGGRGPNVGVGTSHGVKLGELQPPGTCLPGCGRTA